MTDEESEVGSCPLCSQGILGVVGRRTSPEFFKVECKQCHASTNYYETVADAVKDSENGEIYQ